MGVLKNHLKEDHDLHEDFVRRIEKELDYLEATMQCTTEERNVATSFQLVIHIDSKSKGNENQPR